MRFLLSLSIVLLSIIPSLTFENRLWRGTTIQYERNVNKMNLVNLDFKYPTYIYNVSKISIDEYDTNNRLRLRLRSNDKFGGILSSIQKTHNWIIDNQKSYMTIINFFQDTTRTLMIFEYSYDKLKNLELNSIKTSGLRCGVVKNYRMRPFLTNISSFLNLIKNWSYCKTTKINPQYPNSREIKYTNEFDYKFLLTNDDRINQVLTDNLIISLPSIIEDYKPFTFLIGCLVSPKNYKQININYNFKGELMSVEYNEYEPYFQNHSLI